jgi:hypothetical protein
MDNFSKKFTDNFSKKFTDNFSKKFTDNFSKKLKLSYRQTNIYLAMMPQFVDLLAIKSRTKPKLCIYFYPFQH